MKGNGDVLKDFHSTPLVINFENIGEASNFHHSLKWVLRGNCCSIQNKFTTHSGEYKTQTSAIFAKHLNRRQKKLTETKKNYN